MSGPLAHVAGVPVEEAVLAFVPAAAVWVAVIGARLRGRSRSAPTQDTEDAHGDDDTPRGTDSAARPRGPGGVAGVTPS